MNSQDVFEARLEAALRAYGDQAALPFDASAIAGRAMDAAHPRSWVRTVLVPAAILTLLLALAAGIATLTSPPPEPEPLPSAEAVVTGGELTVGAGEGHAAVRLDDGRLLIISGSWEGFGGAPTSAGELWDPDTGATSGDVAELIIDRSSATATLLEDGRVLVVGGYGGDAYPSTAVGGAEVWDPASGSFAATGTLAQARVNHSAILLADGRVLIVGGAGPDGHLTSAEMYDPDGGTFSPAGEMTAARAGHTATLLPDGRVVVLGGQTPASGSGLPRPALTVEMWDPATGAFTTAGQLAEPRRGHTATLLSDGRVLVVGGYFGPGYSLNGTPGAVRMEVLDPDPAIVDGYPSPAEVWDPSTSSVSPGGSLREARTGHTATLLGDGRVAVIGGSVVRQEGSRYFLVQLDTVEIWNPDTGTFAVGPALDHPRSAHSAIQMDADTVLVLGGGFGPDALTSVEVWEP